ncbi:hypothetical protein [Streptomyces sviceus]|uniref:hypothetical protein n=1 Tax=Streptomyces sviceus TaxID=285530 RepID=UPI00369AB140
MAYDFEALKARVRDISYTPGTNALHHISLLLLRAQDLTATALAWCRRCTRLSEAPIDHFTAAERAALQQEIGAAENTEKLEEGVTDGCSPWTCRGEIAASQDDFGLAT